MVASAPISILIVGIVIAIKCKFSFANAQLQGDTESRSDASAIIYQMMGEFYELKHENKLMAEKIKALEENQVSLETAAEENKINQAKKFETMKAELQLQGTTVTGQSETIEMLEGKIESLETDNKANIRLLNQLVGAISNDRVAFFARLSSHSPKLQHGQVIVFSDVLTNVGNGYHNNHGVFIAPVAGVYVFYASLHAWDRHNQARLMKNGQMLAMFDAVESGDTVSQMVIIELEVGDSVSVQNANYFDRIFHGYHYSTFSGHILYGYPTSEITCN